MFTQLILRCTHRLWNRQISRILCRAYEERLISSTQLHQLAAAFDPTQRHIVYGRRRNRGFRSVGGVFDGYKPSAECVGQKVLDDWCENVVDD